MRSSLSLTGLGRPPQALICAASAAHKETCICACECARGSQVKAQIKLKFTSALGKPAVCQRSFSLTQKAQSRQYKAFEAALQTLDEHNEKACLSYKCADLNKLVPEMMGVSPAVLESIVFVHQEDSCWPLSEDKGDRPTSSASHCDACRAATGRPTRASACAQPSVGLVRIDRLPTRTAPQAKVVVLHGAPVLPSRLCPIPC